MVRLARAVLVAITPSWSPTVYQSRVIRKLRVRFSSILAHGIAPHLNTMRVVDKPVENAIRQRRIADLLMPSRDRQLRSQDRRAHLVAILADLPEVAALRL